MGLKVNKEELFNVETYLSIYNLFCLKMFMYGFVYLRTIVSIQHVTRVM